MEEVQEIVEQEEGVMQRETQIVQDYADVSLCPHSRTGSVDTDSSTENQTFHWDYFALFLCVVSWKLKWFHGNDPNDCYLCYIFH